VFANLLPFLPILALSGAWLIGYHLSERATSRASQYVPRGSARS